MEYDQYDAIICEKMLDVVLAVQTFYQYMQIDTIVKKDLKIITSDEARTRNNYKLTQEYYNSLCTEELEKLGYTSNNYSFETILYFDNKILDEMKKIEFKELVPYIIKYFIPEKQYEEIKEKLKDEMEIESELEQF